MCRIIRPGLLLAGLLATLGCSESEREALFSPTDCPCFSQAELNQESGSAIYQCFDLTNGTSIASLPEFSYEVTRNPQTGALSCQRSSARFEDNFVAGLTSTQADACVDAILTSTPWDDCP